MAGLLDTYEQTANAQAWSVLLKMATYFKRRIESVIAAKGMAWWEGCLLQEFGGMNEGFRDEGLSACRSQSSFSLTGEATADRAPRPVAPERGGVAKCDLAARL